MAANRPPKNLKYHRTFLVNAHLNLEGSQPNFDARRTRQPLVGQSGFEPHRCLAASTAMAKEMVELTHSPLIKSAHKSAYKTNFLNCVTPPILIKNNKRRTIKLF